MRKVFKWIPRWIPLTSSGCRRIDFLQGQQLFHWAVDQTKLSSHTTPAITTPGQATQPLGTSIPLYGTNLATSCKLWLVSYRCCQNCYGYPPPITELREIYSSSGCVMSERKCLSRLHDVLWEETWILVFYSFIPTAQYPITGQFLGLG